MAFHLSDSVLRRLLAQNHFALAPSDGVVLVGLRGALPVNEADWEPGAEKLIEVSAVDYRHPRCTFAVWNTDSATIAHYSGSTVPAQVNISAAVPHEGRGVNMLDFGFLAHGKGPHPLDDGAVNQHAAFRQAKPFPYRRTADDDLFETEDRVEVGWPGDNIHCGYCESSAKPFTSSHGCQVVCGFPLRPNKPGSKDIGAWPRFRDLAYASGQKSFRYMLLPGSAASAAALSEAGTLPATLRYGSTGELVKALQKQLKAKGLLASRADGDFGGDTLLGLIELQRQLGVSPDGICGPHTAEALGIADWPKV